MQLVDIRCSRCHLYLPLSWAVGAGYFDANVARRPVRGFSHGVLFSVMNEGVAVREPDGSRI